MFIHQSTLILIAIYSLSWISAVFGLNPELDRDQWTSPPSSVLRNVSQRGRTNAKISLNLRELDAGFPEWENDKIFSFEQFADDNELNQAKHAMLGVVDMLMKTMSVMYPGLTEFKEPMPKPTTTKSLERYFFINHLPLVAEVFKRLLAALSAPGFERLLDCYHSELLTLKVVYGDYFGSEKPPLCKEEPGTTAYSQWEEDDEHVDGVFAIISLCQPFFDNYKDHTVVHDDLTTADRIDAGTTVDTCELPCYSSALTFLHELLHWGAMGTSVLNYVIADQTIWDPSQKVQTKAYRAFYATKMLDGVSWNKDGWVPLSNVDNYVYAVQEIYWAIRTGRQREWMDPLPVPGYYPVNGPPPPGGA